MDVSQRDGTSLPAGAPVKGALAERQSILMSRFRRLMAVEAVPLLVALLLLMAIFAIASPYFLTVTNLFNIGRAAAISGIIAAGITLALIAGMVDLSIASVSDLTAVVVGLLFLKYHVPAVPSMIAGLGVGLVTGLVNGLTVTKLKINPLIATLATMGIVRGIAFLLTGGQSQGISDASFAIMGRSYVLGIPTPMIIMLAVYALTYVVLRYSQFGRAIYAVGGNPVASRLAGLNVNRWRVLVMIWCAFCASFGGLVLLSKLGTMIPNASAGTELDIIAAVILGGTSLAGGAGTIQGTLVGVLILAALRNGLVMLNVNAYWQQIASGLALLVAVGIDQLRTGGFK